MQWIDKCLKSLVNSSYETKIIIIDNGSQDDTISYIRNFFPFVRLISTERNLGFGQGNNIGIAIAAEEKADFCFLLNQDAWVDENTIEELVKTQLSNSVFGIISPIHLNGQGSDFDDHFYEYLLQSDLKEILWNSIGDGDGFNQTISTPFVNAACWLISAAGIRAVGGFDPIFFHYGEDDNFVQRLLYNGFKMGIHPGVVVYHDKERPAKDAIVSPDKIMYKEWVQFLVYACDVNRKQYRIFIIRRGFASLIRGFLSILSIKWTKGYYEFKLGFRILFYFKQISRSHKQSESGLPYLHLNNLPQLSN